MWQHDIIISCLLSIPSLIGHGTVFAALELQAVSCQWALNRGSWEGLARQLGCTGQCTSYSLQSTVQCSWAVLDSVQVTVYSLLYSGCTWLCTSYSLQCNVQLGYIWQCASYTLQYTVLYSVQVTVYSLMYSVQVTVYSLMYSLQVTVYSVLYSVQIAVHHKGPVRQLKHWGLNQADAIRLLILCLCTWLHTQCWSGPVFTLLS